MKNLNEISNTMALYLAKELDYNNRQINRLTYGLEIILGIIFKVIIFTVITLTLNLFNVALVIFMVTAIFRLLAGGVHCSAYHRCVIFSMTVILMLSYISRFLAMTFLSQYTLLLIVIAAGIIALLIAARWAPDPDEKAPIESNHKKQILRILTLISIIVWVICLTFLTVLKIIQPIYIWAASSALILQFFTLTPIGHRLVLKLDTLMSNALKKEVNIP